jgi:hypothetical protein
MLIVDFAIVIKEAFDLNLSDSKINHVMKIRLKELTNSYFCIRFDFPFSHSYKNQK